MPILSDYNHFSRMIALNNRPVAKEAFLLPNPNEQRLQIHGGIDLTKRLEVVLEKLKTIDAIQETTHVYYTDMQCPQDHDTRSKQLTYPRIHGSRHRFPNAQSSQHIPPQHFHQRHPPPLPRLPILDPPNRRQSLRRRILRPARPRIQRPPKRNLTSNPRALRREYFLLPPIRLAC